MNREIAILQKLLHALNDSSTLYRRLAPKTTSSHFRLLLERAIRTHQWIADDLAERMKLIGGKPKRDGSLLGPVRALHGNWLARVSPDIEQAYAAEALRREDAVLQSFDGAIAEATDAELRKLLQMRERLMESVRTQIECLGPPLPKPPYADPAPTQSLRATVHPSEPRTTAHNRT
jgi:uncharacterized protein (TIGR02284 family)